MDIMTYFAAFSVALLVHSLVLLTAILAITAMVKAVEAIVEIGRLIRWYRTWYREEVEKINMPLPMATVRKQCACGSRRDPASHWC